MRRYYINNILSILFLFFVMLFAITFSNTTTWTLFYFMVPCLLLSMIPLIAPLAFEIEPDTSVMLSGEKLSISFRNLSKYRFIIPVLKTKLTVERHVFESKAQFLWKPDSFQITYETDTLPRGVYEHLRLDVTICDFFGFFTRSKHFLLSESLLVLPESKPQAAQSIFTQLHQQLQFSDLKLFESFDLNHIRDYIPGDRINHIDWKLSSKQNSLQYREYYYENDHPPQLVFYGMPTSSYERALAVFKTFAETYQQHLSASVHLMGDPCIDDPVPLDYASIAPRRDLLEPLSDRSIIFTTTPLPLAKTTHAIILINNTGIHYEDHHGSTTLASLSDPEVFV